MATINGTNGNNNLIGGTEDDVIVARGGADNLEGGDGNDVIIVDTAPAGSDTVDGGAGIDIVVLDADYDSFTVSEGAGTLVLTGLDATTETLINVEQVVFNDQTIYIVGAGGYPTIQAAVDAAGPGGIILVTAGTYVEQVDINGKTNLTITAVPGADVTIQAPADVVQNSTSSSGRANNAVVTVEDSTNIVIANITVDGDGRANTVDGANAQYLGVVYRNASGGLDNVDVTGIRDPYAGGVTVGGEPIVSGNQRGVGVSVDNDAPTMGNPLLTFFMEGGSITDFQKNATVFSRADLTINGVTITGGGAQTINAQNGIQVSNSTGTISNNIVTEIGYAGPQVVYSGMILAFGNTDLDITGNTITGTNNDTLDAQTVGIFVLDFGPDNSGGSITGNTISFVDSAIDVSGDLGPDSILISGNTITDIDVTDPFAGGVSFAPNGVTNDTVSGSDAVDFLFGGAGTDTLSGLGGNDLLDGGTGSDTLDGGMGIDTASYTGSIADYNYVIAYDPSGFATGFSSVTHTASGDVDTLTSVEILTFGDATLDLGAPVQLLDADGDLIGTFTTIQGAVDAAGSVVGAVTVLVNDGNYTESVIIDRGDLTLRSVNGRDATTITGVAGAALGAIEIDPGANNVTIGGTGAGFTIVGLNGNGAIENAAIYLQGAHDGITIVGNDVVANGDVGLLGEFGVNNSNLLIDGNIFSGQTFTGPNPEGGPSFNPGQFDIGNNYPRQLVVLGSGNNGAVGTNVVFTNNQVTGTAGGISTTTGLPFGNTLVTIDVPNSVISNNEFTGNTTGNGYAIRARSQDTDIENNSLTGDSAGILVNNGGVPGTYAGNSFTGTAGADVVFAMTDGDDTVTTLDGNDQIGTNGGNDTIDAGAGDDIVLAGTGSDSIDGGDGIDTAVFSTALSGSDLVVVSDADGRVTGFTSVTTGADTDTLTSVERLQFSDATLDLADPVQLFDADGDLVGTFDSIQDAIDAAGDGASIKISAGTYTEQLTIDGKNGLSISSFGDDVVEIVAPATIAVNGTSTYYGDSVRAVIAVTGSTDVTISGLTVDGAFAGDTSPGSNGDELSGIAFLDSTGGIDDVTIENVGNSTSGGLFGLQHGSGLFVDNTGPGDDDVSVTNSTITGFQKTGALVVGADIVFTGNTITGVGATGLTAQNGIQIAQSQGTVSGNTISGIGYTVPPMGTYFYSAGIIAYEPTGALAMDGNTITGVGTAGEFTALDLSDTLGVEVSFQNNVIADATNGIVAYSFFGDTFGLDANPNFTGTTFTNISGLGISFDPELSFGAPFSTATAFNVTGSQFDDVLAGSDGDDTFVGGDGADEFTGRGGSDTLTGGDGSDTANYEGDAADYTFTADVDAAGFVTGFTSVTDTATGDVDTLSSIESLEFGDGAVFSVDDDVQLFDGNGDFAGSFATIQAAIDAASDGFTIRARAGTYAEALTVDVDVTIVGANGGIAGNGVRGAETIVTGAVSITADGVTLDGLTLSGEFTPAGAPWPVGIYIVANDASIVNSVVTTDSETVVAAILTGSVTGLDVGDNLFEGYPIGAYVSGPATTGSVHDNLFQGEWDAGNPTVFAGMGNGVNSESSALTITGNTFDALYAGTIQVLASDPATLDVNTIVFDNILTDNRDQTPVNIFPNGTVTSVIGTDLAEDFNGDQVAGGRAFTFDGNGGNDRLFGAELDDALTGGTGDDQLYGGNGVDTAVFADTVSIDDLTNLADANPFDAGDQAGWTVASGTEGSDSLDNVEIVSHAGGRILLVGNGGFDSIQAAVDAASDGDTILVAAGTYTENVTIDVDVTLLGANHGVSGNDMRGAETVIAGTVTLADDGITIDGFTIDGGGTLGSGIRGASSLSTHSDITIDNNILTGQTGQPILMGFGFGGGIGSTGWSVNDNLVTNISGNNATGIVLFNITGLTLTGNTVDHDNAAFSGRRGINLDGIVDGTITGNTVAEGGPTGTSWGIQIGMSDRAASNLTVSDNTVTGSALGIFTLSQRSITDLTISDNDVTGGTTGILVNGGGAVPVAPGTTFTNIVITGNTVDVTGDAIRVRDLHDAAANGPIAFDTLTIEDNDVVNGLVRVGTDGDGLLNLSGTNVVEGDDGNDSVSVEGTGAVTFDAGDGNDSFVGAGANDSFIGGEGDDVVTGGAGSDTLDGGIGTDTARFDGPQSLYTVTATTGPDGRVTGFSSITDGTDTDTLTSIEILSFDNGATVIDLADAVQLFDDGGNIVGTFDTIQAAVDAAADNYVIRVAAGSYDEDVTVDVGVTIIGAFAGTAGSDGGRDAAAGTGETTAIGRWTITSTTDVTIDGLRFVNDATTTGGGASNPTLGIRTGGDSAGHSVTNSIFWSTVAGGANGVDDRAISTSVIGSGAISITDNLISGTSTGAFGTAAWGRGIWFDGGGVALTVDGNTTQSTRTAVNVDLTGSSTADISNNSFTNAGTGVSVGVDADGLALADNDLTNVGSDFNFRNLTTDVTFDASAAIDTVTPADPANDIVVVLGGTGSDTLTGTDGNDFIDGNNSGNQAASDNDVLTGGLGNDVLLGKAGDDTLDGGDGDDSLSGGSGIDTAIFSETLASADVVAVADVDPLTAGDQAGWTVTTAGGTDALQGVEILSHAGGTIRLVGNGGYATIQEAVDASVDGDTILIAAGSYAEDVIVDVGVTIVGANGGEAGSDVGRDAAGGVGETTIIGNWRITASADVAIDGLRFVNDATTTGGPGNVLLGVLTGGTTGHSITNSIFWSTISGAANDDRAIQVSPIAAGSVSITDNLISGTQQSMFGSASWGRAIWFDGGGVALTVDGNTISWARTAINLDMSGTSTATVSNNDLTNSGTGVSVGVDTDGVTLLDNDVSNLGTDFNFRNLTSNVVFDAGAAVAALTAGFATNDTVVVLGGSGNDTVTGTEFADFIDGNNHPTLSATADVDTLSGLAGNDTIFGRFGNDVLNGGADNDTLDGGDGVDTLFGEDGTDSLTGGEGNDFLDGGTGADAMNGGNGDDVFIVDDFGDTTVGGAGRDTVRTSTAAWTLAADIEVLAANSANALIGTGNALDNTISGSISADTLSGLDGIDTIFGRAGNDTIIGGEGNDLLYGQENDDTLIGGNGNDYLEGGAGLDIMIGGAGDDIYLASDFGDLVAEQSGEGIDTVRAVNANYTLSANVENLQYFGTGNFIGYGNTENNQVIGGNGNDFLYGIAGNDRVIGGSGNDYLDGGIGADNMSGGLGNDSYIVDDIGDVVGELVDQGTDTVQTTLASYSLTANVENLNYIGTGNFTGNGSAVANTIFTQGGNDIVNGLAGNDVISTRAGTDVINGGAGRDIMTGGADADRFVFSSAADTAVGQADRITDFSSAQGDLIDLSAIDAINGGANNAFTFIGSGAFTNVAGQLRVFTQSGNTFVVGDTNGDGVADFQIQVDGIVPLTGTDFIL